MCRDGRFWPPANRPVVFSSISCDGKFAAPPGLRSVSKDWLAPRAPRMHSQSGSVTSSPPPLVLCPQRNQRDSL